MANIDIKLSQNAFDTQLNNVPGRIVDGIESVIYAAMSTYLIHSSPKLSGSSLVYTYSDGAVETYSGFVKNDPSAGSGAATATAYELQLKDSAVVLSYTGQLNLNYSTSSAGINVGSATKGSTIKDMGYATHIPTTDPNYDAIFGNGTMRVTGTLNVAPTYAVTGTINEMSVTSDKYFASSLTIDGNFHVSADLQTDGEGLTHSLVTGTVTGYHVTYADGSHVDVSGTSATLSTPYTVDAGLLANPTYFSGNDTISIDLPSTMAGVYVMASGAGDDQIAVNGGGGGLLVYADEGNDRITLLGDKQHVDGGLGVDTVILHAPQSDYRITKGTGSDSFIITDKLGVVSTLTGVERIQFSDAAIALDVNGNGGEAYRLYQAAFARTPDKAGLGYWISVLDKGASLLGVADGFAGSDEFKAIYGANPSNHDVVERFYQNVLHRAPDQAGLDYWVAVLDNKVGTVAQVLMEMSESAENKAGLIGVIGNGFEYTPYH